MALTTNKKNKIIAAWEEGHFTSYYTVAKHYKISQPTAKKIIINKDTHKKEQGRIKKRHKKSYLYLIRSGDHNYYKIGIAKNLKSRLSGIQTGNPLKIELIDWLMSGDAAQKERELHFQYSENRIRGEWFLFNDVKQVVSDFMRIRVETQVEQTEWLN